MPQGKSVKKVLDETPTKLSAGMRYTRFMHAQAQPRA